MLVNLAFVIVIEYPIHIIKAKCIMNIPAITLLGLPPSHNSMFTGITRQEDICTDLFSKDKT